MSSLARLIWRLPLTVALLTAGQVLHADDQPNPSVSPPLAGFKEVRLPNGGVVMVKDTPVQQNNFGNTTGKYDPSAYDLNRTSPFDGKQFQPGSTSKYDSNSASIDQTFVTKQYDPSSLTTATIAGQDNKVAQPVYNGLNNASGWDKIYATSDIDLSHNETGLPPATSTATISPDQNRTVTLGPGKTDVYPFQDGEKQYLGPGAQNVPKGVNIKENVIIAHFDNFSGLPDRPLTIDEVRDLINHGTAPDTKSAPAPASKPLNDPNYVPRPLRDMPASTTDKGEDFKLDEIGRLDVRSLPPADDRADAVPAPGTMSADQLPESTEPLPDGPATRAHRSAPPESDGTVP